MEIHKSNIKTAEGKLDNSTMIFRNFNTLLSVMNTKTRHEINKKIENYKPVKPKSITLQQINVEAILFSSEHRIFYRTDKLDAYNFSIQLKVI